MDPAQSPTVSNPASPGWSRSIERLRTATAGRFTILRELGRGGFATVFLAQQHKPNRRVAIKLLSPALLDSDWALEHFRGESQKIAEWRHQAVVTIYEVHEEDALLYFVMSYVEGASLHELIQLLGPLPVAIVRSVLAEVGSALQYAHRQGVTHRDIKPHNILVDVDGGAVVTDFGIAKQADGPSHTATGMIVGTAPYMAPEQCESGRTSSASDQYALGIVAYEMLTGTPPFTGTPMAVLMAHLQQPVPSIAERRPDCPPELAAAVLRMLAKKPADRFESVAAAVQAAGATELSELHPDRRWFAESARRLAARQQTPVLDIVSMPAVIEVGESIPILAEARTPAGEPLADVPVEWSSEQEGLVSLDAVHGRGTLTGVLPGVTTVVARGGGVEHQIQLEVRPAQPAVLVLHGPAEPIHAGDAARLSATVTSLHGVPVDAAVHWQSEQPRLATVTADGELHAHQPGRARVVASAGSASGDLWLEIVPPLVDAVRVAGDHAPLLVGEHRPLSALVLDARGHPLADRAVHWSSSDPEVAVVSAAGRVTGCAAGPVTITAACEERTATLRLAVREPPVTAVELIGPSSGLQVGDRIRVQATVRAADGRALPRAVAWQAVDPRVAVVDADGTVTALAPGVAVVAATCEGVRSTLRLAVVPDAPAFFTPTSPVAASPAASSAGVPAAEPAAGGIGAAAGVTSWLPAADVPAASVPAAGVPAAGVPAATVPAAGVPAAGVPAAGVPAAHPSAAPPTAADMPAADMPAADVPAARPPAAVLPTAMAVAGTDTPEPGHGDGVAASRPTAHADRPRPHQHWPTRRPYAVGALGLVAVVALAVAIRGGRTIGEYDAGSGTESPPPTSPALAGTDAASGGAVAGPVASQVTSQSPIPAPYSPPPAQPSVQPSASPPGRPAGPPAAVAAAGAGLPGPSRPTTDGPGTTLVRAGEVAVRTPAAIGARSSIRAGDSVAPRAASPVRPAAPRQAAAAPAAAPTGTPAGSRADPAAGSTTAGYQPGAAAAAPAPSAAAASAPPTAAAEGQLRQLVAGYAAALRARSVDDAVRIYPAMSQHDRDSWRTFFDFARDLEVGMQVEELSVSGATAAARVSGEYRYTNPATRRPCSQPLTLQMRFARSGAGWQITGIDQQQGRGSGC